MNELSFRPQNYGQNKNISVLKILLLIALILNLVSCQKKKAASYESSSVKITSDLRSFVKNNQTHSIITYLEAKRDKNYLEYFILAKYYEKRRDKKKAFYSYLASANMNSRPAVPTRIANKIILDYLQKIDISPIAPFSLLNAARIMQDYNLTSGSREVINTLNPEQNPYFQLQRRELMAQSFFREKSYQKAISHYRSMGERSPVYQLRLALSYEKLKQKSRQNIHEAMEIYKKILKQDNIAWVSRIAARQLFDHWQSLQNIKQRIAFLSNDLAKTIGIHLFQSGNKLHADKLYHEYEMDTLKESDRIEKFLWINSRLGKRDAIFQTKNIHKATSTPQKQRSFVNFYKKELFRLYRQRKRKILNKTLKFLELNRKYFSTSEKNSIDFFLGAYSALQASRPRSQDYLFLDKYFRSISQGKAVDNRVLYRLVWTLSYHSLLEGRNKSAASILKNYIKDIDHSRYRYEESGIYTILYWYNLLHFPASFSGFLDQYAPLLFNTEHHAKFYQYQSFLLGKKFYPRKLENYLNSEIEKQRKNIPFVNQLRDLKNFLDNSNDDPFLRSNNLLLKKEQASKSLLKKIKGLSQIQFKNCDTEKASTKENYSDSILNKATNNMIMFWENGLIDEALDIWNYYEQKSPLAFKSLPLQLSVKYKDAMYSHRIARKFHQEYPRLLNCDKELYRLHKKALYPAAYEEIVTTAESRFQVSRHLILAIMKAESAFYPSINSHAGAVGLMQLMPLTGQPIAKRLKFFPPDLTDPRISIMTAAYLLHDLQRKFNNRLAWILVAYNAGLGNAFEWMPLYAAYPYDFISASLPYGETRNYLQKVFVNYAEYKSLD